MTIFVGPQVNVYSAVSPPVDDELEVIVRPGFTVTLCVPMVSEEVSFTDTSHLHPVRCASAIAIIASSMCCRVLEVVIMHFLSCGPGK